MVELSKLLLLLNQLTSNIYFFCCGYSQFGETFFNLVFERKKSIQCICNNFYVRALKPLTCAQKQEPALHFRFCSIDSNTE